MNITMHHSPHPLRASYSALPVLLLLAVSLVLSACSHPREEALPPGSQVLALGDSLTAGAGVNPDEAWPHLLAQKTGWIISNGGVSGDTSEAALQRLPALLEEHKPALVLVTLGGNDMLRHVPIQQTIANLQQIIAMVQAHGAKVILLATPNPSLMGAAFHHLAPPPFYSRIAKDSGVPLIADAMADVLSDPQLKGDPLHPNVAGHQQLSEKIFKELQKIGYVP